MKSSSSEPTTQAAPIRPRIVIHGGAGNITRKSVPPDSRAEYLSALSAILCAVHPHLLSGTYTALDAAVAAVVLLENNPLFNAGKGAVFTLDGRNELEASVMVSRGAIKKGAGVFLLEHVKNPIRLAKEVLLRDNTVPEEEGGGTKHNCISGKYAEQLAESWGLEIVETGYFWTKKRWEQHLRGLKGRKPSVLPPPYDADGDEKVDFGVDLEIDLDEYLPQGTVGCVALDSTGTLAVATSTGGLTNKLPGRIGDTPTFGAGFWAEEWTERVAQRGLRLSLWNCLRVLRGKKTRKEYKEKKRAVAISGTGNGDMFLRTCACHSIASLCKIGGKTLKDASKEIAGVDGEMDREGRRGPDPLGGEAGVIGIDESGNVVMAMNSGGMFRGTVDEKGRILVGAFRDEEMEVRDPC